MYMATSVLGPRWSLLQLPEGEAGREDDEEGTQRQKRSHTHKEEKEGGVAGGGSKY
jgi:hypothetical protein